MQVNRNEIGVEQKRKGSGIMKRTLYTLFLVALILPLLGLNSALEAQSFDNPVKYGQAGMPFLNIPVGGRAAMASTQMAFMGDAFDMYYNAAGLALIQNYDAQFSNVSYIGDIKHYAAAAAYRAGNIGTFAVGMIWMDYGDLQRTVPTETLAGYEALGSFNVSEYALTVSYARQITDRFYFGGNVKFASQDLGSVLVQSPVTGQTTDTENSVNNLVLDFGTLFYPGWHDLRFGVNLRNFANQSDYFDQRFELPLTFTFGAAMDVMNMFREATAETGNKFTLALDWIHPRDFSERVHIGGELAVVDAVFLRGGYMVNYDEQGLTAGIGLRKGLEKVGLSLDYTYQSFGIFDNVHRFSIGVFGP
jgi:hypothetical protein